MVKLRMNVQCLNCNKVVAGEVELEMMSVGMQLDEDNEKEISVSDFSPSTKVRCKHCNTLMVVEVRATARNLTRIGADNE